MTSGAELYPKIALQELADPLLVRQDGRDVEGTACVPNGITPTSMNSWTAWREEAGGDEHEGDTGPAEERRGG